jgi:hypothetical protein
MLTIEDYFEALGPGLFLKLSDEKVELLRQEMRDPESYFSTILRATEAKKVAHRERLGRAWRDEQAVRSAVPDVYAEIVGYVREMHDRGKLREGHAIDILAEGRQELCWIDSESDRQISQDIPFPLPTEGMSLAARRHLLSHIFPGMLEVLEKMNGRMRGKMEQLAPDLTPDLNLRLDALVKSLDEKRGGRQ